MLFGVWVAKTVSFVVESILVVPSADGRISTTTKHFSRYQATLGAAHESLAYSSFWTYGIPQATTTLSKAISF
jgi:hypothetical protein